MNTRTQTHTRYTGPLSLLLTLLTACGGEDAEAAAASARQILDNALAEASHAPELASIRTGQENIRLILEGIAVPYGARWADESVRLEMRFPPDIQLGAAGIVAKRQASELLAQLGRQESALQSRKLKIAWSSLTADQQALIEATVPDFQPPEGR